MKPFASIYFASLLISALATPFLTCAQTASSAQSTPSQSASNQATLNPANQSSLKTLAQTHAAGAKSQQHINQLDSATQQLLQEYQAIVQKRDYQQFYQYQLQQLAQEQARKKADLQQQLLDIGQVQLKLQPLLVRMVQALKTFIDLDMPFHREQRQQGIVQLQRRVNSPSIALPDKYQLLLEGFQIELAYGQTIGTYRDTLTQDGVRLSVDILRIGRIAMYYRSLDGEALGYWHQAQRQWQPLPKVYQAPIKRAMRVASQQLAPELLSLPMQGQP